MGIIMQERTLREVTSSAGRTQFAGSLRRMIGGIVDELRFVAGGVPESAWSKEDQKKMAEGKLPKGHPEHPNV